MVGDPIGEDPVDGAPRGRGVKGEIDLREVRRGGTMGLETSDTATPRVSNGSRVGESNAENSEISSSRLCAPPNPRSTLKWSAFRATY